VVTTSSPADSASEATTVAVPAVAFGTKTNSLASPRSSVASRLRTSSTRPCHWRISTSVGLPSTSARISAAASATSRGSAPKPPWLR
jgi:hypothetical protein